mgnify:FL=1
MSFRLTTGFSHAQREESAKRIAVLAGVSLRTAESWKRDETEPRVSHLRRLMRCDRLAEAVNVWAGRVEAANAVKRAALERQQLELDLALADHRARRP